MKKIFTTLLTLAIASTITVAGGNDPEKDPFKIDMSAQSSAMEQLDELESLVQMEGLKMQDINSDNGARFNDLNLDRNYSGMSSMADGEHALGIPPFLWGFCLGIAGIAVVYFVTEDNEQTKKALLGCVISTVVGTVLYFVLFAAAFSASTI